MPRRVLIIVGHPDPKPKRLCRALTASYAEGARSAGHDVRLIGIATLDFPVLRTMKEFGERPVSVTLEDAAQAIEHTVFIFPLWLGNHAGPAEGLPETGDAPRRGILLSGVGQERLR